MYEQTRGHEDEEKTFYRASFTVYRPIKKGSAKLKSKREWGPGSANISGTLAVLLPKLKLKKTDIEVVWAEVSHCTEIAPPAMSHKSQSSTLSPAVAFF